jgi:1-deoxyxylulose-5-phosphate synthase
MKYARLGGTGLRVSRICLGCMTFGNEQEWMLDGQRADQVIQHALDLGIDYFDTADVYSDGRSEEILGKALDGHRDAIVATKVGLQFGADPTSSGLSREWILRQAKGSLSRLGRDRIDLYQIHRWDYRSPIEETLRTLSELVREGSVAHLGASSMLAWQFLHSLAISREAGLEAFATMQNRYNLVYREEEREMLPLCRQFNIAVVPYSPLAMGFLSGRYRKDTAPDSVRYRTSSVLRDRYFFDNDFEVLDAVRGVAEEKGVTPAQISLSWLLSKPEVSAVIVGASKPEQLDQAVAALEVSLSSSDIRRLEERYRPHALIGPTLPPTRP